MVTLRSQIGNIYNWMILNNNKGTEDNLSVFNFGFMINNFEGFCEHDIMCNSLQLHCKFW